LAIGGRSRVERTRKSQGFLLELSQESGSPITVVLNWTAGLKKQ